MADPAIECQNLRRTFVAGGLRRGREIVAVADVSFAVEPGTVFGLLGPNGAGKTTTVRVLSTLLMPTAGRAAVAGFDVAREPREVRRRIGLALAGERGLFFRLSAAQNLQYFAAINHIRPSDAKRRVPELLELVGLSSRADSKVMEYSRGMKQRLHLARALLTDPQVLFLDEPTSGLDPVGAFEFRELVRRLREAGRTILLTTHYMLEADELCDDLVIIDKGRVIAAGSPAAIKRTFGVSTIVDIVLRAPISGIINDLQALDGVEHAEAGAEGIRQTLRVQVRPDQDVGFLVARIGSEHVEHLTTRSSSLEEAYLALVRA